MQAGDAKTSWSEIPRVADVNGHIFHSLVLNPDALRAYKTNLTALEAKMKHGAESELAQSYFILCSSVRHPEHLRVLLIETPAETFEDWRALLSARLGLAIELMDD